MRSPKTQNIDAVIAVISDRSMTMPEIAAASGISTPTVQNSIRLMKFDGRVFIEKWSTLKVGIACQYVASYRFGKGIDAVKPKQTREERLQKNRARKDNREATKAECAEAARRERIARELQRPAFRNPFVEAFYGPYARAA